MIAQLLMYKCSKSKGVDKKDKYWLKWGDAERHECVDIYVKRDMKGIQLHYGTLHPPRTTIRAWGEKFAEGRNLE